MYGIHADIYIYMLRLHLSRYVRPYKIYYGLVVTVLGLRILWRAWARLLIVKSEASCTQSKFWPRSIQSNDIAPPSLVIAEYGELYYSSQVTQVRPLRGGKGIATQLSTSCESGISKYTPAAIPYVRPRRSALSGGTKFGDYCCSGCGKVY